MSMIDKDFVVHGPKVDLPVLDLHLGEFMFQKLSEHGDRVALVAEVDGVEKSLTYTELLHMGKVVSCVLKEHGLQAGDTVMISCLNTLDYAPVYLGALFSGVACAPVYPLSGTDEFKHLLSEIKPHLVLCDAESHRSFLKAVSQSDQLPALMALDVLARRLKHATADSAPHFQMARVDDVHTHVAVVLTSSGTTGRPKGVELSHATFLYMAKTPFHDSNAGAGLGISGPYWASGTILQTMYLTGGAKLVLLRKFTEKAYMDAIQKHEVSISMVGPDQVTALAKWPLTETYDTPSLKFLCYGGSRVTETIRQMAARRLKKMVFNGYGLTESMAVFNIAVGVTNKPGSVGTVINNASVKVVDVDTGTNLGPNCEGELCVKTPVMLVGYRGKPEATKALFDAEGFIKTGDVGYYDEEGYFYVVDRIKELIKYKNIQVTAADLEEVLLHNDGVKEAAVVGIQNDADTEHATAFIVRQPGATVTDKELVSLVEGKLPLHKWLHGGVVFLDELPKTATGKVKRRQLKTLHAEMIGLGK